MEQVSPSMIKVRIPNDPATNTPGESMWAEEVKPGFAKLQNSPFFAYGYACDDVVRFNRDRDVTKLIKPSGYRNYRIMLPGADQDLLVRVDKIIRAWMDDGVPGGEGGFSIMLVYSVKPDAIDQFDRLLLSLQGDGLVEAWEVSN